MVREMLELLLGAEGLPHDLGREWSNGVGPDGEGTLKPDIVIADYNLPGGMTGLETIAGLRGALHREIPAIILTGDISTGTLRKIAQGRCVHLNKPANAEDLTGLIASMLGAPRSVPTAQTDTSRRSSRTPTRCHPSSQTAIRRRRPSSWSMTMPPCARPWSSCSRWTAARSRPIPVAKPSLKPTAPRGKGCLVVDAQMQGMGGLALLEWLKSERSPLGGHHDHRLRRRVDGRQSHESRRRGFHREADQSRRIDRRASRVRWIELRIPASVPPGRRPPRNASRT